MRATRRRVHKVMTPAQVEMFGVPRSEPSRAASVSEVKFDKGDVQELFIGGQTLASYLKGAEQTLPVVMVDVLAKVDFRPMEARYKGGGRPPYHPAPMVGLMIYGLLKGKRSLREMEELARLDLGCIFVARGLAPDHASLGRFIHLHTESLTGSFLEEVTARILSKTSSGVSHLAGDGTILQACASRLGLLKEEAARQAAEEARAAAAAAPEDPVKAARAELAAQANTQLAVRKQAREGQGKDAEHVRVSPTEPEAAVQKMKDGRVAPSYKASVVANQERFIVGQAVDPTREIDVVEAMLEQAQRVGNYLGEQEPSNCQQLLLDGGYLGATVLEMAISRDIDLLCPVERGPGAQGAEDKLFSKDQFHYDPEHDHYRCPAGEELVRTGSGSSRAQTYAEYTTLACRTCPLRPKCTRSKTHSRRIKRYDSDEAKQALKQVMSHPLAQARFQKRQGMVEPVFSTTRGAMKFNRFHRRGLQGVRVEFALHAIAYNFHRLACLLRNVIGAANGRLEPGPRGQQRPADPLHALLLLLAWVCHVARGLLRHHQTAYHALCHIVSGSLIATRVSHG